MEYAALNRAALASLRLLAADAGAPRRRVVVAADVSDGAASAAPDRGRSGGAGRGPARQALRLAKAASVHVDSADAEADVTARPRPSRRRTAGTTTPGSSWTGQDHELLWYATQEIPEPGRARSVTSRRPAVPGRSSRPPS
ncbi:hypothetical protein LV779_04825 [Streptomyces thinghirensis]|nr:hypothetical protein [Streptomyces thinghirensis]